CRYMAPPTPVCPLSIDPSKMGSASRSSVKPSSLLRFQATPWITLHFSAKHPSPGCFVATLYLPPVVAVFSKARRNRCTHLRTNYLVCLIPQRSIALTNTPCLTCALPSPSNRTTPCSCNVLPSVRSCAVAISQHGPLAWIWNGPPILFCAVTIRCYKPPSNKVELP